MEGFIVEREVHSPDIITPPSMHDRHLIRRWVAFLIMSMLFMVALLYLSALALPPG